MHIGIVGLGAMGAAMAPHILDGGHVLTVYNRTASKAEPLVNRGAHFTGSLAALGDCEVVISMLADDEAVLTVVEGRSGLASSMKRGAVHVCMATISPKVTTQIAALHAANGQSFVSAPVLGRPAAAEKGELVILPAGDSSAIEMCMPIFRLIGNRIIPIGDDPSAASTAKIAINFLVASALESLAESFALVRKAGMDPETFLEIVTDTIFNSPLYNVYAPLVAREAHEPASFTMPLGLKDVRLALATSAQLAAPLPIAGVLQSQMITAIARGYAEADWSALGALAARNAGLGPIGSERS